MIRPDTARLPRRFAPRNDKSGGFAPLNFCRDHCQSARRSLSAATDAIGVCYFNDSRYKSAVGAPPISHKNIPDAAASGISLSKKSFQTFSPNCFQNCKINFCSTILQFCRCGGLFNAKGNPDGFLSHFSSLRSFWLGSFFDSLPGESPCPLCFSFVLTGRGCVMHRKKRRAAAETAVKNAIADSTFHHNGFFLRKQPKRRNWTGKIRIDGDF